MDGAKELVKQKGLLMVESFDAKARSWALEAASEEGSRHFTRIFNAYKKAKKELVSYITQVETAIDTLVKTIEERNEIIRAGKAHNETLITRINQLESDKRELVAKLSDHHRQLRPAAPGTTDPDHYNQG